MKATDVMTKTVVTVHPETPVKEVASLMAHHHISGMPVVDQAGAMIGIISETDLLHRAELGTERQRKWWLKAFTNADTLARDYTLSHAAKASDIMSKAVVSVSPETSLADLADLLDKRKLKRVPVVANGKPVGMITRSDLVRALVQQTAKADQAAVAAADLASAVRERMRKESWLDASLMTVSAKDGVVELIGLAASEEQRRAVKVLAEATPGVKRVEERLQIMPARTGV